MPKHVDSAAVDVARRVLMNQISAPLLRAVEELLVQQVMVQANKSDGPLALTSAAAALHDLPNPDQEAAEQLMVTCAKMQGPPAAVATVRAVAARRCRAALTQYDKWASRLALEVADASTPPLPALAAWAALLPPAPRVTRFWQAGDSCYRGTQACTVVKVVLETDPPHVVVRTAEGSEVGTEPGMLREYPDVKPGPPPASARAERVAQAILGNAGRFQGADAVDAACAALACTALPAPLTDAENATALEQVSLVLLAGFTTPLRPGVVALLTAVLSASPPVLLAARGLAAFVRGVLATLPKLHEEAPVSYATELVGAVAACVAVVPVQFAPRLTPFLGLQAPVHRAAVIKTRAVRWFYPSVPVVTTPLMLEHFERCTEVVTDVDGNQEPFEVLEEEEFGELLSRLLAGLAGGPLADTLLATPTLLEDACCPDLPDRPAARGHLARALAAWTAVFQSILGSRHAGRTIFNGVIQKDGGVATPSYTARLVSLFTLCSADVNGAVAGPILEGLREASEIDEVGHEDPPMEVSLATSLTQICFALLNRHDGDDDEDVGVHINRLSTLAAAGDAKGVLAAFDPTNDSLQADDPHSTDMLQLWAARALFGLLRVAPQAVRAACDAIPSGKAREHLQGIVSSALSFAVITADVQSAQQILASKNWASSGSQARAQVRYAARARQATVTFSQSDLSVDVVLTFPASFPLAPVKIEVPNMVGISETRFRRWVLQLQKQIDVGALATGLSYWFSNLASIVEGLEDCPICYSLVHLTSRTLPRSKCATCKHLFHNECIFKWFRTSTKNTCPLCQSPF